MRRAGWRWAGGIPLVAATLLGSGCAVGLPDQPRDNDTRFVRDLAGGQYADQPATGRVAVVTSDQGANPIEAGQDRVRRDVERGELFGAHATTGSRWIALSFDDGPDPQYTPQVLAALRRYGVRATFCVVGENARKYPDLVQAIVADGHTLCNHSWNHDVSLGKRSPTTIRDDLLRTNAAIRAAAPDAPIVWYRQPGGAWTRRVVSVAHELGMSSLHWSVDPSDWQAPAAARIVAAVTSKTAPGSIVLLHDAGGNRRGTVDALDRILPDLAHRFQTRALPTHPS